MLFYSEFLRFDFDMVFQDRAKSHATLSNEKHKGYTELVVASHLLLPLFFRCIR